uniref:60S ribosome subunit biogenesis protein NIP7 homolog n=1 Tax=Cercocebus atys TaxID=9531 RepID=A0A2K5KKY1_CERAT
MRTLTEEETRVMFKKTGKYIRETLQLLVYQSDGTYCFWLHNDQVYYVREIMKLDANISGDTLASPGTCFRKFTKTHKALNYLAPYANYKVWIKPGAEQSFVFGNHVLKYGLGQITENTSQYWGVVVYSMADIPLVDPVAIVVLHQADIGEYARHEETLTQNEVIARTDSCVEGLSFVSCVRVDSTSMLNFVNTMASSGTS